MMLPHCLDEKSETQGLPGSFLNLNSMTATLYTTPDLMTQWVVLTGHS